MLFIDFTYFTLVYKLLISTILKTMLAQEYRTLYHRDLRQAVFLKDEFHYLNVSRVGIYTVYGIFDCTFKCLSNPSCLSLNLATSKGADKKLWCELLSSTKHKKPEEFWGNESAHHFSIQTACLSSPCQNGGTCVPDNKYHTFKCSCEKGFIGEYCEKAPNSCKDFYEVRKSNMSQVVTLILDSKPTSVLCHMGDFGCGDGAWTPVMKIDGTKRTFHYDANIWSTKKTFNLAGGETGFDGQEAKLPTYWNTSFSKICLGMKIGQQNKFLVLHKQASSLYSLIADGQYRATSLGRNTWKTLIGSGASLQAGCNKEGFNAVGTRTDVSKARIGILGNEVVNGCHSPDSRIGFGTGGLHDDSNTCGNEALDGDNGARHIKAMGYILVQ